jgi:hypothetical protein
MMVLVMPAPIVNVAPTPPAPVTVKNEVHVPPIPQVQRIKIERNDDDKITGANIQRNGARP